MTDHGDMSLSVSTVRTRRKWLPPAVTRQREHAYVADSTTGRCQCGLPRRNASHTTTTVSIPPSKMGMLALLESVWHW